ncbi:MULTISPECIES: phosphoadenylyl-sulfate reductase [Hyphomicrobium]|jgi:phosphoadenosine phosphosulfate reductase|uniref:phosphoadenylyl-sulfate reductase n=1 Tax=Hyphomicrobium TaxID=81 RepID=UPI00037AA663|nr:MULTISPECIES: phosphoadenylyl-sulfate reductase [Hyphomicrobium]WBT36785.1 phosphoadenylyl-sulfate reductase [Hyphomicrobium sp. DMF-1]
MSQSQVRARAGGIAGATKDLSAFKDEGEGRAAALNETLAAIDSLEGRLHAIADAIPGRVTFSTSLGLEDQAVLHAIAATGRPFDVFTLDTGRHFPETLETLDASELRYGLKIRVVFPEASDVEMLVARDGIMGFRQSIEARKACCDVRKVRPLNKALAGADGWLTGLRRDQSAGRALVPFAVWDAEHSLVKLNPIADWSLETLEAYIAENGVPVNPLHARGFPSIGCQPCTRAIRPGEDIRAGRWWWENEDGKECGLHNRPKSKETQA